MTKHSRRYIEGIKDIDFEKAYDIEEAVNILKQFPSCKFDETLELSFNLNADPKKSDQIVRGTVVLPHGTGKELRIIAFCKDNLVEESKKAGAIDAGGEELIKKIQEGWLDFDIAVSVPSMMKDISSLGKILGPRGMMPNPKAGTLTDNLSDAIQQLKKGKIEFKMDSGGNIHVTIGKLSFDKNQIVENAKAMISAVQLNKPASIKAGFIKKIVLTSSMGPGIRIKLS